MANSVDNRVVSMKFDNTNFEKNAAGTMTTLAKLKDSLNFGGAGKKSLDDLSAAAGKFSMAPMATQIEGVNAKFLALSTVAITALSQISSKVISVGSQMVKSLTFAPINDGFKEYETNMNSIQTILANTDSKGTTLDDVNGALDQLNTYADKTIYNFSQMTKNIGTFTAAGVDLDTSVQSIKGIANLAALSGSNSEQASTAMYQLSQAIAAGSVKLMDWNSVVNAGMGGEVFQKALFETGKTLGTIKDVPIGQTFDQWTAAGNTFRGSLESGWITGEVLTTTLQGFTGDLTEAQAMALGYTKEQAAEVVRLGQIGKDAATKVKTLTQLLGTVKEAIGSGWSTSFRLFIGNFEQAQGLFTGLSNFIGKFVEDSATARNDLLAGWANFGGRQIMLEGLVHGLSALKSVIETVKRAFRDVFPKKTAADLIQMSIGFRDFMESLKMGVGTSQLLRNTLKGLFGIFSIGIEVVKGIFSLFTGFVGSLSGVGGGVLALGARTGNLIDKFQQVLVEGGGIKKFFDALGAVINRVVPVIWSFASAIGTALAAGFAELQERFGPAIKSLTEFGNKIKDFFGSTASTVGGGATSGLNAAVDGIAVGFDKAGDAIEWVIDKAKSAKDFFAPVIDMLSGLTTLVADFFDTIGSSIADMFGGASFDGALKAVKTGLIGGIVVIIGKFMKDGINVNLGGNVFEKIAETFDTLTGTIKTFQNNIKADTLMKIAAAMGVLAVAILALSFVNPEDLAKSMAALAVGFAQLVGVMAILNTISTPQGTAKLVGLATAMILLSGAVVVLALAVQILSGLTWEELAKGLTGVIGALGALALAAFAMSKLQGSMFRASLGLIGISISLLAFAVAIRAFSGMSWEELAKGLLAAAVGIGLFVGATVLMDKKGGDTTKIGVKFLFFALGLRAIASAVQQFAEMKWQALIQGFIGLAATLALIVIAAKNLPDDFDKQAIGLLVLSGALYIISKAVESMGQLGIGELLTGLIGLAAILAIVAIATNAMNGAMTGVVALIAASGALYILAQVMKEFAGIGIGGILTALLGIAGVLAVLAVGALLLAPVLPLMLALGVVLTAIGIGFALFGLGAKLVGEAFQILAGASKAGVEAFIDILKQLAAALPEIATSAGLALANMGKAFLDKAPELLDSFKNLLLKLLDVIIEITPKIAEVIGNIVTEGLKFLREKVPEFIATGLELLIAFLKGIRDNIYQVTELVIEIISGFINSLADNLSLIIEAGVNLLTSFLDGIAGGIGSVITAGLGILTAFLDGIASGIDTVIGAATNIITTFLLGIGNASADIARAGGVALSQFLLGIAQSILTVVDTVTLIITTLITELGNNATKIADAGFGALKSFLGGLTNNAIEIITAVGTMITDIIEELAIQALKFVQAGVDAAKTFLTGMVDEAVGFVDFMGQLITKLLNGMTEAIKEHDDEIADGAHELGKAIIDALVKVLGLDELLGTLKGAVTGLADGVIDWFKEGLGINSPSKEFIKLGKSIPEGLVVALNNDRTTERSVYGLGGRITNAFQETLKSIPDNIAGMDEFNPTITPVLDLSNVQRGARQLNGLLGPMPVVAASSYARAQTLATTTETQPGESTPQYQGPTEVKFEQNNYSPKALSAREIYRNTNSQIAKAKEELAIP